MSTQQEDRYTHLRNVLGEESFSKIRNSKVLVVGAGGIGCELLKNLVLSGFGYIEIIDLDTIDVTNLNRQFLFRQEHVGKSKAMIARESALRFNPDCKIVAHHGNIKDNQFGLQFFKSFSLVLNALDNIDARRHVNRMCLAVDIPLIDGGTAGYLGQVMVIKKNHYECYECNPKVTQKTFAVCTIRSNPSKMIHCVVWAKLLFERLFGEADDSNAISNFESIKQLDGNEFAAAVFEKVFYQDIMELLNMKQKSLWANGKPEGIKMNNQKQTKMDGKDSSAELKDQIVWSLEENIAVFLKSATELQKKRAQVGKSLEFDKDDELALDFVTSASNLRAHNFHIKKKSKFSVKAMAGNIVPAIATTNAIIAGMLVSESIKVLNNELEKCRMVHCVRKPSMLNRKPSLIYPVKHSKPNPNCYVCQSNYITLKINTHKTKLKFLVEEILKNKLSLLQPSVMVDIDYVYECGEGIMKEEQERYDKMLTKLCKEVGIVHNAIVAVDDFMQDIQWKISILHEDIEVEDFVISGKVEVTAPVKKKVEETKQEVEEEDDLIIVEEVKTIKPRIRAKKRGREGDEETPKKKRKVEPVEVIEID